MSQFFLSQILATVKHKSMVTVSLDPVVDGKMIQSRLIVSKKHFILFCSFSLMIILLKPKMILNSSLSCLLMPSCLTGFKLQRSTVMILFPHDIRPAWMRPQANRGSDWLRFIQKPDSGWFQCLVSYFFVWVWNKSNSVFLFYHGRFSWQQGLLCFCCVWKLPLPAGICSWVLLQMFVQRDRLTVLR